MKIDLNNLYEIEKKLDKADFIKKLYNYKDSYGNIIYLYNYPDPLSNIIYDNSYVINKYNYKPILRKLLDEQLIDGNNNIEKARKALEFGDDVIINHNGNIRSYNYVTIYRLNKSYSIPYKKVKSNIKCSTINKTLKVLEKATVSGEDYYDELDLLLSEIENIRCYTGINIAKYILYIENENYFDKYMPLLYKYIDFSQFMTECVCVLIKIRCNMAWKRSNTQRKRNSIISSRVKKFYNIKYLDDYIINGKCSKRYTKEFVYSQFAFIAKDILDRTTKYNDDEVNTVSNFMNVIDEFMLIEGYIYELTDKFKAILDNENKHHLIINYVRNNNHIFNTYYDNCVLNTITILKLLGKDYSLKLNTILYDNFKIIIVKGSRFLCCIDRGLAVAMLNKDLVNCHWASSIIKIFLDANLVYEEDIEIAKMYKKFIYIKRQKTNHADLLNYIFEVIYDKKEYKIKIKYISYICNKPDLNHTISSYKDIKNHIIHTLDIENININDDKDLLINFVLDIINNNNVIKFMVNLELFFNCDRFLQIDSSIIYINNTKSNLKICLEKDEHLQSGFYLQVLDKLYDIYTNYNSNIRINDFPFTCANDTINILPFIEEKIAELMPKKSIF